ncbi:MAG: Ig-like domain-containing protein [Gemmatimonadaceae bacterium]
MRRVLIAAIALLVGCASAGAPPGGPEDKVAPRLVRVSPDTNAVNVRDKVATFYFDEVINDRGEGPQDVGSFFLVSPSDGTPRVSWHRSRIDVRPRRGFRDNTAYTITLLPGLSDLRSNSMKTGTTVVFATGATIPTLRITGTAFDWVAERPAPRALIEAITPDSIVYLAQSDTAGRFVLGPLNPGSYLVRAIIDQNSNRALDRGESWDSVRVTTPQAAPIELLTAARDTLSAKLLTVATIDSVTLRLTFDRLLDPSQSFTVANVRILTTDSAAVPITAVRTPREDEAIAKAEQQAALDSVRRADSLAGKPRPAPPPAAAVPLPAAERAAPATPSRPPPYTTITLIVGRPLLPNTTFLARVTEARALSGRVTGSERRFTTPRPSPKTPTDTSAAPRAPAANPAANPAAPPATTPNAPPATTPNAPPATPPPARP